MKKIIAKVRFGEYKEMYSEYTSYPTKNGAVRIVKGIYLNEEDGTSRVTYSFATHKGCGLKRVGPDIIGGWKRIAIF